MHYAIQHKTTGAYLGLVPSLQQDPQNPPDVSLLHVHTVEEAACYPSERYAELERNGIDYFRDAYRVVAVFIPVAPDGEANETAVS